jgi:hypothetical protein
MSQMTTTKSTALTTEQNALSNSARRDLSADICDLTKVNSFAATLRIPT